MTASGEGADLPRDAGHLAARVASDVRGSDHLAIEVVSEIPVGRGLGSSAALAVAAAAAAGAEDPFSYGVRVDGHPENSAASAFGGLVVATYIGERPVWRRFPLDPGLRFVAVIPDRELPTKEARAAIPERIPHADAVFNLGRMGLMLAGLADRRQLVAEAGDDRLHQDYRAALFPEAAGVLVGLRAAGALTSFWSGAGPTLLAVCSEDSAEAVSGAAEALVSDAGLAATVRVLVADTGGITLSSA